MRGGSRAALALLTAVAACLVLAMPALGARGRTTTTQRVAATVSNIAKPARTRLKIRLNGATVYDHLVRSPFCGSECSLTAVTPGKAVLKVIGLEPRGLDVVLGLFSGGAHCCFIDQVFSQAPGSTRFVKTGHNFLDSGARLQRLRGRWAFMSADARIAEESFTDYADSGAPVQIFRFADHRFVDVTRQFPALIRSDAARWMRAFKHHISNGVGLIAAWAADQDLLGHHRLVSSTLRADARKGILHSALGLPHNSQRAFVTELQRELRKLGY